MSSTCARITLQRASISFFVPPPSERDLAAALQLYRELIAERPNTPEAAYSRAQIQNIINAVVPAQELLDAQIALAVVRLEGGEPT